MATENPKSISIFTEVRNNSIFIRSLKNLVGSNGFACDASSDDVELHCRIGDDCEAAAALSCGTPGKSESRPLLRSWSG